MKIINIKDLKKEIISRNEEIIYNFRDFLKMNKSIY